MNFSAKLGSAVKNGNLWKSYIFPHRQWAICGPERLAYMDDRDVLNLPSKSTVTLGLEWLRWMAGARNCCWSWGNLPAAHSRPAEPQLLSHAAQLCKVTASSVPWAGVTLYHTGCAFRDDKQRHIWADMEPQNVWKLRTDMAKEIKFLLCDLQLNTPLVNGHPYKKALQTPIWDFD